MSNNAIRRDVWLGLVLIGIYLTLALTTTQFLHFSRALDEGYHLEYVTFIKQNGRLPMTYAERAQIVRADFPPLYQLLVASVSIPVIIEDTPDFKYFWNSFRHRAIDHQLGNPWTLDTEDFQPPYLGRFLVWQIGRWLSVLLSIGTLMVVFATLQVLPLGPKPLIPIVGTALLIFIPRYLIVNSAFNDDSLLAFASALYFFLLVKIVQMPNRWWPMIALGVVLGVATTIKYSLILMPFEIAFVLAIIAYRQKFGWFWFSQRLTTIGLLTVLCSSWWFGWNIWFFNTIAEDGLWVGLVRAVLGGGYNATLNQIGGALSGGEIVTAQASQNVVAGTWSEWLNLTFLSFWGYTLAGKTPFAPYAYGAVLLMLFVSALGLWCLWRDNHSTRGWILLAGLHVVLLCIIPIVRFATSGRLGQTAQGRHILIPAATAIVVLIVWGLNAILPTRLRTLIFSAIIAGLIAWSGAHVYQLSQKSALPLPMRTVAHAAKWLPEQANAQFGDGVKLMSYQLEPHPQEGQLTVNLAWLSLAEVNQSYLLQVALLNEGGQIVSHWAGYNGQGRVPTLGWHTGDVIFDRLTLPLFDLPAGRYSVHIQMRDQTDQPVEVIDVNGQKAPHLSLAQISLVEDSVVVLPHQVDETAFAMWDSTGPVSERTTAVRYPGTFSIISASTVQLLDPAGQTWSPAAVENNIQIFVVGPRWQSGSYQLLFTSPQGKVAVAETTIQVENWWQRTFEPPAIAQPLTANFANQLRLLGYKLPEQQVRAGDALPVTLYWQALPEKSPQASFIQFNNLLDSSGTLRGGYERHPLEYYQTLLWAPSEVVMDGYTVPVDADAPPGPYYLDVGYYITVGESAVNLPLVVEGEMTNVSRVTIGPIEVIAP